MAEIRTTYIDSMGDDLRVVNAARVSFAKESEWEHAYGEDEQGGYEYPALSEGDVNLVRYLAKHNHWSPFSHCIVSLHVKAPLFVARQAWKHTVGATVADDLQPAWNEVSRRYVDEEPEFYMPEKWRARAANKKQGSSDEAVSHVRRCDKFGAFRLEIEDEVICVLRDVLHLYRDLIDSGVAPELARMILPQNMMTEWWWTGSLAFWARVWKLRSDSHAQHESQLLAQQISDIVAPLFPVSWEALTKDDA